MKKTEKTERYILQEANQSKLHKTRRMPEIIVAFFLLSGIFFAFEELYYSPVCLMLTSGISFIIVILLELWKTDEKKIKRVKTISFVLCIVVFIGLSVFIVQGLLDLCNRVTTLWNVRFDTEIARFSVRSAAGAGAVGLWVIFAVIMAVFVFSQIEKRRFYGIILTVAAVLWLYFVLEQTQRLVTVICLLAGVVGLMILYTTEGRRFSIRGSAFAAAGLAVLVLVVVAGVGYQASGQIEDWKEGLQTKWERWRYGEDSLPQGDFQKAAELLDGDQVTLHLETEQFSEMYLRGFVGGTYEGTQWEPLTADNYQGDNEGMLRWLEQRGFIPVTQYAAYNELTDASLSSDTEYDTVSVKNENAYRKYLYLPATAAYWDEGGTIEVKDWQVQSKKFRGADTYTFAQVKSAPMADDATVGNWLEQQTDDAQQQYLESEAVYHSFVADSYTQISDDLKQFMKETFFSDTGDLDFTETTKQIRKVLRENTIYTTQPEQVPEHTDYIHWFLQNAKRGNAVAYATTAVMAYRAAGYPARYVEGYHLSAAQAQALQGKQQTDLTTENAHAWVEVYQSGIGWLPVEVVPGMYVEQYTNQVVAGQPAYQVNQSYEEDGLNTSSDGGKTDAGSQEPEDDSDSDLLNPAAVISIILIVLYLVLIVYLILEIQRALRLHHRRKHTQAVSSVELLDLYLPGIYDLYQIRGIEGNSMNREDIWEQLHEKFPELKYGEYYRVLKLVQKVKFGEKELRAYEKHALESYYYSLIQQCYAHSSLWQKMQMRYFYCFELAGGHK